MRYDARPHANDFVLKKRKKNEKQKYSTSKTVTPPEPWHVLLCRVIGCKRGMKCACLEIQCYRCCCRCWKPIKAKAHRHTSSTFRSAICSLWFIGLTWICKIVNMHTIMILAACVHATWHWEAEATAAVATECEYTQLDTIKIQIRPIQSHTKIFVIHVFVVVRLCCSMCFACAIWDGKQTKLETADWL